MAKEPSTRIHVCSAEAGNGRVGILATDTDQCDFDDNKIMQMHARQNLAPGDPALLKKQRSQRYYGDGHSDGDGEA